MSDGTFTYPAGVFFANAPKEEYQTWLRARQLPADHMTTPYVCLYLDTGRHRVLVDTGAGRLGPTTGRLVANLRRAGVEPADIDTVILTHAHADHIGGNCQAEGQPAFPRARYVMSRREWDFWTGPPDLSRLGCSAPLKQVLLQAVAQNLEPLRNQLDLLDQEGEIVPGVRALAAPGHTPGHWALDIRSRDEGFLDAVDTALHPLQIEHPEWFTVVDTHPELAVASRQRLLARAAATGVAVLFFHFRSPGLGRVTRSESGFVWRPLGATAVNG